MLKPQQLADVLACVISRKPDTLNRIGDARDGLLRHDEDSLRKIWGSYDRRLWTSDSRERKDENDGNDEEEITEPPFVSLLHRSGLAYPLFDPSGQALNVSLVMAMLPEKPDGHDLLAPISDISLRHLLICPDAIIGATVAVSFKQLPSNFLCRLQAKLKNHILIGSAWKYGFAIIINNYKNSDSNSNNSYCIIYEKNDTIIFLSFGCDSSARTIGFLQLISLMKESYQTLEMNDVLVTHEHCKGRTWDKVEIVNNIYCPGYLEFNEIKISLQSFEILFDNFSYEKYENKNKKVGSNNIDAKNEVKAIFTTVRMKSIKNITLTENENENENETKTNVGKEGEIPFSDSLETLESLVRRAELHNNNSNNENSKSNNSYNSQNNVNDNNENNDNYDVVINMQLQECIPDVLHLLGVKRPKHGLRALWIVGQREIRNICDITSRVAGDKGIEITEFDGSEKVRNVNNCSKDEEKRREETGKGEEGRGREGMKSSGNCQFELRALPMSPGISLNEPWLAVEDAMVPIHCTFDGELDFKHDNKSKNQGGSGDGDGTGSRVGYGSKASKGDKESELGIAMEVDADVEVEVRGSVRTERLNLRERVTDLLHRTLRQLGVLLPEGWNMAVLRDLNGYEVSVRVRHS